MTTTEDALAGQLRETETRLSADLWAAAISRKFRRFVIIGGIAAFVALAALGGVVIESVHVNTVLQQQNAQLSGQTQTIMRELHKQSMAANEQNADILQAVQSQSQSNGAAIAKIESLIDPAGSSTRGD